MLRHTRWFAEVGHHVSLCLFVFRCFQVGVFSGGGVFLHSHGVKVILTVLIIYRCEIISSYNHYIIL